MPKLTKKERVQDVANALLAKSQQKSSAKTTGNGRVMRGKVLYWADNGPFVIGDENECMFMRPSMPCYYDTTTPQNKVCVGWAD